MAKVEGSSPFIRFPRPARARHRSRLGARTARGPGPAGGMGRVLPRAGSPAFLSHKIFRTPRPGKRACDSPAATTRSPRSPHEISVGLVAQLGFDGYDLSLGAQRSRRCARTRCCADIPRAARAGWRSGVPPRAGWCSPTSSTCPDNDVPRRCRRITPTARSAKRGRAEFRGHRSSSRCASRAPGHHGHARACSGRARATRSRSTRGRGRAEQPGGDGTASAVSRLSIEGHVGLGLRARPTTSRGLLRPRSRASS